MSGKRIISAALILVLLASLLSGCLIKPKDKTDPSDSAMSQQGSQDASGQQTTAGGTLPSGHLLLSAAEPPNLDGFLQAAPDPIGKPGVDFQLLETGDPNDWTDMPAPLINPLGSKSLYSYARYIPLRGDYAEISWLDGVTEVSQRVYGEIWNLEINNEKLTTNYIRWYAKELGGTLFSNTDDRVTFRLEKGNQLWWASATWDNLENPRAELIVVKQDITPLGQTLTLKPSDSKDGNFYFITKAGSSDFITVFVEINGSDGAEADIRAAQYERIGAYTRSFAYSKDIGASYCRRYALDDIPQTDEPLFWYISLGSGTHVPESITIRFEKTGSIIPVNIGEKQGSIRVIGAPGSATLTLQSALNQIKYEDGYSLNGAVDSEGNTVFHVPAGYYNIKAALPGEGDGGIRMVPVNSGELTEVVLPDEFKSTYSSFESLFGNFDTNQGSISIHDNKDNGDTAEVSFLVNDPLKRDVFPEKKDVTIAEGGIPGEILDIKRQTAPVNVVLVIDTSGSMGNFMKPTIEAAKKFVSGLPEKTNIRLISFESNVTDYKETGREAVLKNLDKLKSKGGTALYDAASKGLDLLGSGENNFLVVFADGADSRELKNQGKGSSLSRDQIVSKIKNSETTVLTIGFGEGHDPQALIAMSMANDKGAYFSANDEAGLDQAFAAVSGKFGNEFVITYKRPESTADIKSEQPVVGVMIDDSGSMSSYRDAVMTMFHDFFAALPDGSLIQFSKFGNIIDMMHMTTDHKPVLMQSMAETGNTGGGTEVIKALKAAARQLSPLPTNKKAFIFVTDAAMDEVSYRGDGDTVLKELKDEGIRCLFVGVSDASSAEQSFKYAAELSGGDYIITNDINEVAAKMKELEKKILVPLNQEDRLPFSIGIKAKTDDGSIMDYYATKSLTGFSLKTKAGRTQEPRAPKITTGGKMIPLYDKKTARLITGGVKPGNEVLAVTSHIDYEENKAAQQSTGPDEAAPSEMTGSTSYAKSGKNQLVTMTVKDAYTFDVLGGVAAKSEKQFTALNIEIDFPKNSPSQMEAYMIPSILQHFYLTVNNGSPVPASKATWLASKPLSVPGDASVTVTKGSKKSGVLVFYTDKPQRITQLSLHYYDVVYGHIQIPLAGKINDQLTEITSLPISQPARITDAFSMSITGKSDQKEYGTFKRDMNMTADRKEYKQYTMLRTIQARFDSNVQALLNIDPMERFYYVLDTAEGPLMTKMNNIVYNMPLGFTGQTMLAPGASNLVHMPFEIPEALSEASSRITGDISGGSLDIPVTAGSPVKTSSMGLKFSHEYFDLTINSLSPSAFSNSYVILDITVTDKKDGYGTTSLNNILALEDTKATDDRYRYIESTDRTSEYLYGIDSDWAVLDGQTRRGILEFSVNYDQHGKYVLRSPQIPDMSVKISADPYPHPELMAMKHPIKVNTEFEDMLSAAVSKAVAKYEASKPSNEPRTKSIGLSANEPEGADIPAPAASVFGSKVMDQLSSLQDFYHVMYAIRWLPSPGGYQNSYYAPEAVLAQGWGSEYDMLDLAESMLAKLGIESEYREVKVLERGKEALKHLSGTDRAPNSLHALAFTDDNGQPRIFVVPFMRDASELSGLIYLPSEKGNRPNPATARMIITATVEGAPESEGSAQSGMFGAFADAMGGASGGTDTSEIVTKEIELFNKDLSIPSLSLGPIDIGYYVATKSEGGGDMVKTVVSTTDGLLQGGDAIDTSRDKIKSVTVQMRVPGTPDNAYVHTTILENGQKLTDICHTLGFGLPEMGENTVTILMQESNAIAASSKNAADASNASKVKWFTRNTIYRYIAARTAYDNETAKQLDLILGRVDKPMAVMITCKSDGTNAIASFDLMHHQNQVLKGEEDNIHSYNLFSGIYASVLEGSALPGSDGISFLDVWRALPKGTGFILVENSEDARNEALTTLKGKYPPVLLERLQKSLDTRDNTVFLIPKEPGTIAGKQRWAWLEIDEDTYEAVSVFDTGERSGMASYTLGMMNNKLMQTYVGYFVGLSCATWAISAYSLEFDDYATIRAHAAMLCADVLEMLEEFMNMAESGPADYVKSKIKDKIKDKVSEETGVDFKKFESIMKKPEVPLGFVEGFKIAVEVYFGLK